MHNKLRICKRCGGLFVGDESLCPECCIEHAVDTQRTTNAREDAFQSAINYGIQLAIASRQSMGDLAKGNELSLSAFREYQDKKSAYMDLINPIVVDHVVRQEANR